MSSIAIVTSLLLDSPAVTGLVSEVGIYPIEAPQGGKPPFIVLGIVGRRDDQLLAGSAKYYQSRVSIDCLAEKAKAAIDIGDAVLFALEDVVKQTVGQFRDVDVWFANTDVTDSTDGQGLKRRLQHFYVQYR